MDGSPTRVSTTKWSPAWPLSQGFMPSSHWLTHAFVLLLVACNGAALPTPSATPPLVRTDTPRPSSTLTSTSTPTPTQTAPPSPTVEDFRRPADPQHALLLAVNAELEQSIFFVELEADLVRHLYTLPSNISLHGESGNASGASLPRGLPEGLMFLSPDGSTLVTLQPAFGGLPNFLHQIDLLTGDVTSLVLLQNYQLTLPSGPYRSLELISPDGNLQNATVASMFYGLAWAPDSQGFGFILGTLMDFGVLPQQLYHVAKGSTRAAALASSVPGRTSGYRGEWSPEGRYIAFAVPAVPDPTTIWLIDLEQSGSVTQLATTLDTPTRILWAADLSAIYFQDELPRVTEPDRQRILRMSIADGQTEIVYEVEQADDESIEFHFGGVETPTDTLFVYEVHHVEGVDQPGPGIIDVDPSRSLWLSIDLETGRNLTYQTDEAVQSFRSSPATAYVWAYLAYRKCAILLVPPGTLSYGTDAELCDLRYWSPDGRLLAGTSGDSAHVFDPSTDQSAPIAPMLEGEKIFLGWIPDPSIFDAVLSSPSP